MTRARKKFRSDIEPGKKSAFILFDAIAGAKDLTQKEIAVEVGFDSNQVNLLSMAKFGGCGFPLSKVKKFCQVTRTEKKTADLAEATLSDFQEGTFEALKECGVLTDKAERVILEPLRERGTSRKFTADELESLAQALQKGIEALDMK